MFGLFGKPSPSKFAKIVMDAAQKAGIADLMFDEPDFSLSHPRHKVFLGNLYDEYCKADRAKRQQILNNIVGMLGSNDETTDREEAFEQVIAVIREPALFAFMELRQQIEAGKRPEVPCEPIGKWFGRALVLDAPGFMRMVSKTDLQDWDVSFDELFEVGLKRLRASAPPQFRQENGYFVGAWDDDYDSSRVLVPELFEDLPIEGDPVFCIPNRLTLLVADSSKPAAVQAMLTKAEEIVQNQPRPQNASPLTYRDGEIVDFSVPPDSELFHAVQRARGLTAILYYDEQQGLLDALHQKSGKDIYVGKFTLTQLKDGSYRSYTVWSKGVATLMPRTDLVIFYDPDLPEQARTVASVKWEDVQRIAGDLMLVSELFPPRFYVSKFPSPEQFARMPKVPL